MSGMLCFNICRLTLLWKQPYELGVIIIVIINLIIVTTTLIIIFISGLRQWKLRKHFVKFPVVQVMILWNIVWHVGTACDFICIFNQIIYFYSSK